MGLGNFDISKLVATKEWRDTPANQQKAILNNTFDNLDGFKNLSSDVQANIKSHYLSNNTTDYSDMYGTANNKMSTPSAPNYNGYDDGSKNPLFISGKRHVPINQSSTNEYQGAGKNTHIVGGRVAKVTPQVALDNYEKYNPATTKVNPLIKKSTSSTKRPMAKKPGPKKKGPVKGSKNQPKVAARQASMNPFSRNFSWGSFGLDNAAVRTKDARNGLDTTYGRSKKNSPARQQALTAKANSILDLF